MRASTQQKIDDRVFLPCLESLWFGNTEAKKQIEETIAIENATLQLDNRIIAVYPP